ncbi:uncharacterized protein AMSG_09179 [Thecamonas trahens ATCC 50062]|uniref:LanC-like protein 2 n=1 Tax=Thecamonas trahens ATCC 50062 TaxID=461836 RepID=A0A0L0DL14_THETB|nr:hypothetical protein AMSG_09179 [Thecamonas trahens ATCC 50062]KNC53002.1 hypothetical protein AMSG_09179 [Thecamonas trahens ATCC 50062]|eukprot:XP_013754889.1 hypothetical protein AMSG_09179 [Thecamonas trahens ATCC 50062]
MPGALAPETTQHLSSSPTWYLLKWSATAEMAASARYFANPFLQAPSSSSSSSSSPSSAPAQALVAAWPELEASAMDATARAVRKETARMVWETYGDGDDENHHFGVYTGLAGAALAFLHMAAAGVSGASSRARKLAKAARRALKTQPGRKRERITFHEGEPGVWAVSAAVSAVAGDDRRAWEYTQELISFYTDAPTRIRDADSDEILYGRAGYLLALLFVESFGCSVDEQVKADVVTCILDSGRTCAARAGDSSPPLMYAWHKKRYFGAAHGLSGILYTLLRAWSVVPDAARADVRATIDWFAASRFESGNWPSSMGNSKDRLVQWCHGAPGAIHMLCEAAARFDAPQLLDAAVAGGDVIWERGVLTKAPGLCHGLAGNGFALLALHRATGVAIWLVRARAFLLLANSPSFVEGHETSDNPCSLYQGTPARRSCHVSGLRAA